MREIKFRGISISDKKWIYGDLVTGDCYYNIGFREIFKGYSIIKSLLVITETIGQYTGLKDKNDTEIFEGDIVRETEEGWEIDDTGVVKFSSGRFYLDNGSTVFWSDDSEFEIIGNIYINPELS